MVVFAIIGVAWGLSLGNLAGTNPGPNNFSPECYALTVGLVGSLIGLVVTPYLTTRPLRALRSLFARISAPNLFAALIGLTVGLVIAALLAYPLSLLPSPLGSILPFIIVILMSYLGMAVFTMRQRDLMNIFSAISGRTGSTEKQPANLTGSSRNILLDTSVIIDGRIADIARTGFLPGSLLIPRFVLAELQYIADSPDSLRRQRGRRGMEVLATLQKDPNVVTHISDIDVEGVREVDDKLVILARQMRCPILTNDFNLNRIAELQGVTILNINELANAVKSVLLPGEMLYVQVIQEGKEVNQGVGYLDDGTMVVIEGGREHIDREINVIVTKVLQTAAGRMIFARPERE
jgi:uncharacterized protein YacL